MIINEIIALAAKLPSGLNDPKAADKLLVERDELLQSLAADDRVGALTEAADAGYYTAKHLQYVAQLLGVTVEDVLACTIAKYSLRAIDQKKDDTAERLAVLVAMKERV